MHRCTEGITPKQLVKLAGTDYHIIHMEFHFINLLSRQLTHSIEPNLPTNQQQQNPKRSTIKKKKKKSPTKYRKRKAKWSTSSP